MKKPSQKRVKVDPYYGDPVDPRADGAHVWVLVFFGIMLLFTCGLVFTYLNMSGGRTVVVSEAEKATNYGLLTKPDLMEAIRYANGGMENLEGLHTKTMSGKMIRNGEEKAFEMYATHTGEAHINLTDSTGNSTTYTFTHKATWLNRFVENRVVEVRPAISPEAETYQLICEILNPALAYATWSKGNLVELTPVVRTYGIDTVHLKVSHENGKFLSDLYINPADLRIIKRVDYNQEGRKIMERTYTEYRRIRGIDQPSRVLQILPDKSTTEWLFNSVQYNSPNALTFYRRPAGSGPYEEVQLSVVDALLQQAEN